MAVYGYARVSTTGQTLAAQDAELTKAGSSSVWSPETRCWSPGSTVSLDQPVTF